MLVDSPVGIPVFEKGVVSSPMARGTEIVVVQQVPASSQHLYLPTKPAPVALALIQQAVLLGDEVVNQYQDDLWSLSVVHACDVDDL